MAQQLYFLTDQDLRNVIRQAYHERIASSPVRPEHVEEHGILRKSWIIQTIQMEGLTSRGGITKGREQKNSPPLYDQIAAKLGSLKPTGRIQVDIGTEKEQYEIGDPFEIRFRTDQDCYVILMDIGSAETDQDGEITFWLPNGKYPDNKITGDKVYSTLHDFDMNITIGPPQGFETIHIFCSTEKIDLFATDFKAKKYYTITPDDEGRLKNLLESLDRLKDYEWSMGFVTIHTGSSSRSTEKNSP
jgi:hypothetical protein